MKHQSAPLRPLALAGLIAGLYAVLTLALAPLSFGPVQCRLAEALTVLAAYTPAAVPGLGVGCALANVIGLMLGATAAGGLDVLVGTATTVAAAWLSYALGRHRPFGLPVWSTLPPVLLNALAVGTELAVVTFPELTFAGWLFWVGVVGLGELVACVGGGLILAQAMKKTGFSSFAFAPLNRGD